MLVLILFLLYIDKLRCGALSVYTCSLTCSFSWVLSTFYFIFLSMFDTASFYDTNEAEDAATAGPLVIYCAE